MQKKKILKLCCSILLLVVLSLGIFFMISSGSPLQANDTADQEQTTDKTPAVDVETKEVAGKTVLMVPTEKTDKEIDEFTEKNYKSNESLVTPVIALSENPPGTYKSLGKSGKGADIQIPKAGIKVMDGTASWDPTTGNPDGPTSDANAGRDSSATNGVVRSWDQITYLLDFSVQNMNVDTTYTNIKYQVTATLPDAVTMMPDGTTPQLNGEIANGQAYKADGTPVTGAVTGAGYSEGIMESSISDTGQIFIPIVVNVFGAPNGQKLQPTFQVKIVSADRENKDGTTETVTMDETYDNSDFSSLSPAATAVTAKPSVSLRLVNGERSAGGAIFGLSNDNVDSYNVGAVTELRPLQGRGTTDYRGTEFPKGPITYEIKQKATMTLSSGEVQSLPVVNREPMTLVASAIARNDRNQTNWNIETGWSMDHTMLTKALSIPNGITNQIYTSQPTGELLKIGVYNSGSIDHTNDSYVSTIKNNGYQGLENPYTYTMTGNRVSSASKPFSSAEFVFHWDRAKTHTAGVANNWQRYKTILYVDSLEYDGVMTTNDTSVDYETIIGVPGGASSAITVQDIEHNNLGQNNAYPHHNTGNARIKENQNIWFRSATSIANKSAKMGQAMVMWDPSGFEFDTNRSAYYVNENADSAFSGIVNDETAYYSKEDIQILYGVAKDISKTPSYTMKVQNLSDIELFYNWFDSPAKAQATGEISSVHFTLRADVSLNAARFILDCYVPIIVKATPGSNTPKGNPLTVLGSARFRDSAGRNMWNSVNNGENRSNYAVNGIATFNPTVFNNSGIATSIPTVYWNHIGECMYVEPFSITTKTEIMKSQYDVDEEINIRVNGILSGINTMSFASSLTTTLPKGIIYKVGSTLDAQGESLPDPTIIENSDGTTTLRWEFPKSDMKKGTEVNFKVTSDFTQLVFKNTGLTENLNVKTVGEIWVMDNPENKDNAPEMVRSSSDTFRVKLDQQLVLTKKIDKKAIEVGTVDPADSEAESSTDVTYTVTGENNSTQDMTSIKLLDVLPYNGDSRKTNYHGDYRVQSVTATIVDPTGKPLPAPAKSKLFYTTDAPSSSTYDEKSDPNAISGWTEATASNPVPSDVKGVLVEATDMPTGGKIVLTITIRPNGKQKAGDMYRNNARLNSVIDNPVTSQVVETKVYARDLAGYVWYDDDYDGLIGNKSDGSPEDSVENIPVKLYRTSLENDSYVKELVKESLIGEKFINASGESLIKTDSNGKYKFENLPEGKYIAEFMVDDLVVQKVVRVTKQLVGSDETKNSKADPTDYKTLKYEQPKVNDLPALLTGTDKVHHITDVNAGLTRLSKLRLFKYEEGSAVDSNADGKLSEAEIESSGRPLKDAEFDIYKGDSTSAADKIGSAKTDSNGWLEFPGLIPGDYTIVETKAPKGFELLKDPIKVTITTYNSITKVHVSDNGQTALPFTGGTGPLFFTVMIVSALGILGLGGLYWYYRQPSRKGER